MLEKSYFDEPTIKRNSGGSSEREEESCIESFSVFKENNPKNNVGRKMDGNTRTF